MDQDQKETIRLLIIDGLSQEAEDYLNVYRDAGFATRAHHVTSIDSLDEALAAQRRWDLLLISDTDLPEDLPIASVLDHIEQKGRDIPAIVLVDDLDDVFEFYKIGARAVIHQGDKEQLLLISEREVDDLKTRRNYRRMSVALHESEKQRRNLLDDQVDAILYVSEGVVRYSNPAFNELIGLEGSVNIAGKPFTDLVAESERKVVGEFLINIEDSGQAIAAIQCPLLRQNSQSEFPVTAVASPTSFDGHYTLSLLVRPQAGEAKEDVVEETIQEDLPDRETHLYDKTRFNDQLDLAVQRVVAGKDKFSLMCIMLDSLRAIHVKGGSRISQPYHNAVSVKLGDCLSEHKACNWSSDCFMVLLKAGDEKDIQNIADDVLESITREKVAVGSNNIPVQISIGAVLLTDTNNDLETLLIRAKHAASMAMKQGGNKLSFYQARKAKPIDSVEKHLAGLVSQAFKNDGFKLMYQPVVSLKGCVEKHFDVQLRMVDVRGREHDSASFRSRLDKNALWGKVDRWQVIQAGKDLMNSHTNKDRVRLFFHLGGNAFKEKDFLPWMNVALKAAQIKPSSIVIEMSEQNIVRFNKEAPQFFGSVKAMGFGTGISEFGCSLNPLETIKSLDIDYIKLDASFTKDLTSEDKGEELKEMIQALADNGQKVVVPEVQSAAEMAPLWYTGVDFIQGEFLQMPSNTIDFDFDGDS